MIDRLLGYLRAVSFHRGLALGALVGSAIAGSTLWGRIREARGEGKAPRSPSPPDEQGLGRSAGSG